MKGSQRYRTMLKLSTKTRYALRFMIELALHEGEGLVHLAKVAEAQDLSQKYLEQLAMSLRHAGLVNAERGSRGGYELAQPAADITALQIVQAVEGPFQLIACVARPSSCDRSPACAAHGLWGRLSSAVTDVLAETTVAELCADQRKAATLGPGAGPRR